MSMNHSVVMTDELNKRLTGHLIRDDGQEDLCFATYLPSSGSKRFSGIIRHLLLPEEGERLVHGNVEFMPEFFERVLRVAVERKEGIAFLHSHPGVGWQGMSIDDELAEARMAPAVLASTSLPLLGLTVGNDGAWSARFWQKDLRMKRKYDRCWCENVRVVPKGLAITFNDNLLPSQIGRRKQVRTISAWGEATQRNIARLRVGIVGLGSVGSIVAEALARIGISYFALIDFDKVEEKNTDRTLVLKSDIGRPKVMAARDLVRRSATSPFVHIETVDASVCEEEGFGEALNSDVLFSCVDRPWPRQVMNFIAYAHLIPVIDGGILVRTNKDNTNIIGADWKCQTVGYTRTCLECLGQYKGTNAALERGGFLDDPSYLVGISREDHVDAHENVFAFSLSLASMEVLQMLSLIVSPSSIGDVGQQNYHFVLGRMDVETSKTCQPNCYFQTITGQGDRTGVEPYGVHERARSVRAERVNTSSKRRHSHKQEG